MSSLPKANWNGQTGKRAQVSIGMHSHPKIAAAMDITCGNESKN
jgi:hypothetical protein